MQLRPIGHVESPLTDAASAPKQGDEGAPEATLVFDDDVLDALRGIRAGDQVVVLTWLDRARRDVLTPPPPRPPRAGPRGLPPPGPAPPRRDVLTVHPRGDTARAPQGVFASRSPH